MITPEGLLPSGELYIVDGKIEAVGYGLPIRSGVTRIDAQGQYISPGFIDLHVHGGGGADFMDGSVDSFLKVAQTHARHGTTALSPTTLTSHVSGLLDILDTYKEACKQNVDGASFIGMHLEGPYFSVEQRGAQDPRFIRDPDPAEYEMILDYSEDIVRWSAAPELPGALEFGRYVRKKGKMVALAHTNATFEQAIEAFEAGYTLATHFYSAMSGITRKNALRYGGVIEAGYYLDDMDVEIIADGVHVPASLLKLIYKIKGSDRIALVTDAMRAAGTDVKQSILGNMATGLQVIIEDGVAKIPDRSAFAGSIATADRLIRTATFQADIPLLDSVKMMTATPARIASIDHRKGSLKPGLDADVVLFDKDINVSLTMVGGKIVFNA